MGAGGVRGEAKRGHVVVVRRGDRANRKPTPSRQSDEDSEAIEDNVAVAAMANMLRTKRISERPMHATEPISRILQRGG